jgi:hypothetical protein
MRTWTARMLTGAVVAGAVLTGAALPASAGTSVTSWGNTREVAVDNAINFCRDLGGKLGNGPAVFEQDGTRFKATIPCNY